MVAKHDCKISQVPRVTSLGSDTHFIVQMEWYYGTTKIYGVQRFLIRVYFGAESALYQKGDSQITDFLLVKYLILR